MPKSDSIYSGKILKVLNGQEETAQDELMNLLYLARADENCDCFDLYRSNFQINKSKLQSSFFFIKEGWRGNNSRNEVKNALFESEEYQVERIELSGSAVTESSYGGVFTSIFVEASAEEREGLKKELYGWVQSWRKFPGCSYCALYQEKNGKNIYYIEQIWENSNAFNNAQLDRFEIETVISTEAEIYIMQMVSNPAPPITVNAVSGDPQLIAGLRMLNKDFGELCVSASAIPWGKNLIDQKTKIYIALAVDVVEQITGKPFENHITMARKQGVTREELEELLLFMSIYAGFNKAGVFYSELDRIFGPKEKT